MELKASLTQDPGQAAWARALVSGYLLERGVPDNDIAILLVSELVTNAILHGAPPLELRATHGSGLRVEVRDGDAATPPALREDADLTEPGGRGLQLVDTLADRWGWSANGRGKVVWFELDC